MIVSNIGITPDFSAIYTSNSGQHTAFVQVSLKEEHTLGSYEYMRKRSRETSRDLPELSTYFQAGGLVDSVVNLGLPAPIDIQVSGSDHARGVRDSDADLRERSGREGRQRRADSAGSRLSGDPAQRESRDGSDAGSDLERGGGQRHHCAELRTG